MTREEASFILANIDRRVCDDELNEALDMAIKALEQEPCGDWYDVPSDEMTLEQARQAVRHLRKKLAECLEQEPYEDAISRSDMIDAVGHGTTYTSEELQRIIKALPPVNPQPKTGHWIAQNIHNCHTDFKCSECGYIHRFMHLYGKPTADYTYCPSCGSYNGGD